MSALRLRETFNRLLRTQFAQYVKKGAIALAVAASVALPAAADHNENNDLRTYDSQTRNSLELRSLQQEFNRAVTDRRIILVDRDWIEINRALNDVRDNEALRNRYLTEQLVQQGRLHINSDFFKGLNDAEISSAHSQLVTATRDDGSDLRVCLVFGGQGDHDIATRIRDFIDVSRAIHGSDVHDAAVRSNLDPAVFKRYISYHEVGHCMDDFYLPQMRGDFSKDPVAFFMLYHRAESFSDVYGALLMARDQGVTDMARQAANIRLANMALAGPFQVEWSDPSSTTHYASFIYATHRSLNAAQDYIDKNGAAALQAMSYQQVAELARDIVDRTALNRLEHDALMYLFATKFDMTIWDRLKGTMAYVDARHPHALALRQEIAQGLREMLDLKHIAPGQDVLSAIPFRGTPGEYIREMRQRGGNQVVQSIRAEALAGRLYRQAGGSRASIEDLLRVFTEHKDQWRATLSTGTEAERQQAMESLSVAGKALWLAAHRVRGTDPAAANQNTPAPAPAPQPVPQTVP